MARAKDLYPTKTRLRLLRAVEAGNVLEGVTEETIGETWDTTGAEDGEPARKVTARVDELMRAGWADLVLGDTTWHVTDAGRAVLAANRTVAT